MLFGKRKALGIVDYFRFRSKFRFLFAKKLKGMKSTLCCGYRSLCRTCGEKALFSPTLPAPSLKENHLCSQYEEKVRPCIDLIDSLRALGVEKDLALPAIAVIGDQSSGKSSVLEALSGVALPRGSAQNAIAGEGLSISNKLITLEISSPDVPDLTLIDLPGITRVAVGNQPQDIGHQIMKLIQSYITKQETINLVVVPSNVDIATTEALKMAQTVDPEGERTLGILTKPDLIDEGTEDETIDIVRNQRVPLKKGYMIVKCRGQSDLINKLSLEDAIKKEREFFEEHKFFSVLLEEGRATIPLLAENLTQELTEHIQKSLPALEKQIEISLEVIRQKLQKYGEGVPESLEDKKFFFVQKINAFNKDLLKIVNGEEDIKYSKSKRTITDIRQAFNQWQDTINDNVIGFVNFKVFEDAIKWQIEKLEYPAIAVLKEVAELVRNTFLQLAVQHFSSYYALCNVARSNIEDLKLTQEEKAKNMIATQFKLENVVYCQDTIYSKDFRTVRATKISSVPDVAGFQEKCSVEELLYHMTAYYKSVKVRLGTQIPMIIQLYVFRDFAERLQNAMMQILQSGDQLEILFREGRDVVNAKQINRVQVK
ncbi:hypothetical protein Chor_000496 [Crotalus horridus]